MQSAKSTTWPHLRSRPRRQATRVVAHEAQHQATQSDTRPRANATPARAIELPPPGPSNIVVTTANPLPVPRNVESQ